MGNPPLGCVTVTSWADRENVVLVAQSVRHLRCFDYSIMSHVHWFPQPVILNGSHPINDEQNQTRPIDHFSNSHLIKIMARLNFILLCKRAVHLTADRRFWTQCAPVNFIEVRIVSSDLLKHCCLSICSLITVGAHSAHLVPVFC